MKPRLLDLFCGAGGAAVGYARAGFEVVGVDHVAQPNYPFDFERAEALTKLGDLLFGRDDVAATVDLAPGFVLSDFDAIHASPPCQHYANVTRWKGDQDEHPDLIGPTRELLEQTGLPWVMENVRTKALRPCVVLCGTTLGLRVRRHRGFETNWNGGLLLANPCQHRPDDHSFDHGAKQPESVYRDAMGCEWMTVAESREAIPPAMTEHIGGLLLSHLKAQVKAVA